MNNNSFTTNQIWDSMILGDNIYKIADNFNRKAKDIHWYLFKRISKFPNREERHYLKTRLKEIAPDFVGKQGQREFKRPDYDPKIKNYAYYKAKRGFK